MPRTCHREVDLDDFGLDQFCRVKVLLNIFKPLRRKQRIKHKDGQLTTIEYKYERIPHFCFRCGVLGHSDKGYSAERLEDCDTELGWGARLKASPHKGRSRNKEEVSAIKARRMVIFVTKDEDASMIQGKLISNQDEGARCSIQGGAWVYNGWW